MTRDLLPSAIAGIGIGAALSLRFVLHGWPLVIALFLIASVALAPIVGGMLARGTR